MHPNPMAQNFAVEDFGCRESKRLFGTKEKIELKRLLLRFSRA